jgi:hypothetical protein
LRMKKKLLEEKGIIRIALPVFLIGLVYYVSVVLKPFLYLHVQQSPFLTSKEFFVRFLNGPGGISQYVSQFMMQGFNSNFLGTIIIISIVFILALLLGILLKRVTKSNSYFLPCLLLISSLALIQNYYLPFVVFIQGMLVLAALVVIAKTSLSKPLSWIKYLIVYLSLYYIAGSGSALVFIAGSIIILALQRPVKFPVKIAALLVVAVLIPYLAYRLVFNITQTDAYVGFIPDLSISVKYITSVWFYLYVFLVPILLLLSEIGRWIGEKLSDKVRDRLSSGFMRISMLVLLVIASALLIKVTTDPTARKVALCDYSNYTGNYEKTIDIALSSTDEYNISINLAYNLAIANKGELCDRLLDYPQVIGSQALQPDKLGSPVYVMVASDFFYDLGYISKAQHFAYAHLAINPDNTRAKKRLVVTNILLGNVEAAQVYLNSIADSYHSEEFVNKYKPFIDDPGLVSLDPVLSAKLELTPDNFAIPAEMTERLHDLLNYNDSNILAFEFLQCCYILDHQLNDFAAGLDESLKFYNRIPLIYEQAILMYFFNAEIPGLEKYPISKTSKDQFNNFIANMSRAGNDTEMAKAGLTSLSSTYMYYVTYLSPKVTNVKIIQQAY